MTKADPNCKIDSKIQQIIINKAKQILQPPNFSISDLSEPWYRVQDVQTDRLKRGH